MHKDTDMSRYELMLLTVFKEYGAREIILGALWKLCEESYPSLDLFKSDLKKAVKKGAMSVEKHDPQSTRHHRADRYTITTEQVSSCVAALNYGKQSVLICELHRMLAETRTEMYRLHNMLRNDSPSSVLLRYEPKCPSCGK